MKHALLSASGAHRWLNCTPSARLEEDFKDQTSVYAQEGTLAHEFAETLLVKYLKLYTKARFDKAIKVLKTSELYSPEMDEEVLKYTDFVKEQFRSAKKRSKDAILLIEEKVDLTDYIPEGFGTCDAIIIADGIMEVIDLKYGKGVQVEAHENPQLMLYGLGALCKFHFIYDIEKVRLNIVQPRLNHISTYEISSKNLFAWGSLAVKPLAEKAFKGEGEQCAGDWCKWCKAAPRCKALADKSMKIAQHKFADPKLLTDDQLMEVYKQNAQIADWLKKVAAYVLAEALAGKKWNGYKLVEGRAVRKWKSEEDVCKALFEMDWTEEDIFQQKLLGITAIEKLLGKNEFSEKLSSLVIKPQGKPTLVDESDKRPAFGIEQAKEIFKNDKYE
jgi:hypothetical protein